MSIGEQTVPADSIEVLSDGSLQIREAIVIVRDGAIDPAYPKRYRRYVLSPGADLAGKDQRIVAVAQSVWTAEVIAEWQAARATAERF